MASDKSASRPARGRGGWWFLAATVLLYGALWLLDRPLGEAVLADLIASLKRLAPMLAIMFVMLWLLNLLLKPARIVKRLGAQSGIRGWLFAIGGGVLSMGPMYLWYPVLGELHKKGLRPALAAAFLYSRAVKIPMLPFMALYFGGLYTGLFVTCILVFSVLSGLLMERIEPSSPTRASSHPHD